MIPAQIEQASSGNFVRIIEERFTKIGACAAAIADSSKHERATP
ncbi:MAG: hypothetical protein N2035_08970 [Chthoniobacterales bacterium]|nr:hypothetical protein [Chthoniobacterales bacterium]